MSLMTLSISRSSLFLAPLVVGTTGFTNLEVVSWQPGRVETVNDFAESDNLDGGFLIRHRAGMTSMSLLLRVKEESAQVAWATLTAVTAALTQRSYTITQALNGFTVKAYDCSPATLEPQVDPALLQDGFIVVACSIPRQP